MPCIQASLIADWLLSPWLVVADPVEPAAKTTGEPVATPSKLAATINGIACFLFI
jgi:hypothetical protein